MIIPADSVYWTAKNLARFEKAYAQAKIDKVDTFKFQGREYLVEYAKYLIEYLKSLL